MSSSKERIQTLGPGRLLEIGCGSGLTMFAALPHCVSYTGIDFSPARIGRLRELRARPDLKARFHTLAAVELRCKGADELQWVESNAFDTIALPSVIQYFPTVDYLLCVLDTIFERGLAPDGSVFIGDVRSLLLLEAFHASVRLFKANPDDRAGERSRFGYQTTEPGAGVAVIPRSSSRSRGATPRSEVSRSSRSAASSRMR